MRSIRWSALGWVAGILFPVGITVALATPAFVGWSTWGPVVGFCVAAFALGLGSAWFFSRAGKDPAVDALRLVVQGDEAKFFAVFNPNFRGTGLEQSLLQLEEALAGCWPEAGKAIAGVRDGKIRAAAESFYQAWRAIDEHFYDEVERERGLKSRGLTPSEPKTALLWASASTAGARFLDVFHEWRDS